MELSNPSECWLFGLINLFVTSVNACWDIEGPWWIGVPLKKAIEDPEYFAYNVAALGNGEFARAPLPSKRPLPAKMKVIGKIYFADNLEVLRSLPSESVDLIYIDPPFNTGKIQSRTRIRTVQSPDGDRVGFQGRRYKSITIGTNRFIDIFDDYLAFLEPRLTEAYRILAPHGSLYFHIDYREVHYCKVLLDAIFGRDCFLNEIIWAYDYGGRPKDRWPPKHDNILLYAKRPGSHIFNLDEIERIPYMAPGLVGPEKAARGKLPTDTWWHTIVPTNSPERTGYPTQKPLGILRRIIQASSRRGQIVLDFFAGSGATGVAALELGRRFILVDNNPQALEVMARKFAAVEGVEWVGFDPSPYQARSEGLFASLEPNHGDTEHQRS
jgi:site-specific DNA-methyltransferase (adenine-specific)